MITEAHQQTGKLLERHARLRTAHPALIRKIISALGGRMPAVPAAGPEIARELYVSVNTVRTHMRHVYDKLGAHRRLEAINRARALGLFAPVPQQA